MEENKPVSVEKTEAEVGFDHIHRIHISFTKYSLNFVVTTLKLLLTQVREADEKEDTVAMPPPQVSVGNRMLEIKILFNLFLM